MTDNLPAGVSDAHSHFNLPGACCRNEDPPEAFGFEPPPPPTVSADEAVTEANAIADLAWQASLEEGGVDESAVEAEHDAWIRANYPDAASAYGKCAEATRRMVDQFPELRRARGIYDCPIWGERTHWWCVTAAGAIVDPTAAQFPSGGIGAYVELADDELPTGKCLCCGVRCYEGRTFCSRTCAEQAVAELNAGAGR